MHNITVTCTHCNRAQNYSGLGNCVYCRQILPLLNSMLPQTPLSQTYCHMGGHHSTNFYTCDICQRALHCIFCNLELKLDESHQCLNANLSPFASPQKPENLTCPNCGTLCLDQIDRVLCTRCLSSSPKKLAPSALHESTTHFYFKTPDRLIHASYQIKAKFDELKKLVYIIPSVPSLWHCGTCNYKCIGLENMDQHLCEQHLH